MPDRAATLARRALLAALLASPLATQDASAASQLQPGNIWIQVPEKAWRDFLEAAAALKRAR